MLFMTEGNVDKCDKISHIEVWCVLEFISVGSVSLSLNNLITKVVSYTVLPHKYRVFDQ